MKIIFLVLLILLPVSASAEMFTKNKEERNRLYSYYPTPKEIYDDCVKAIEIAKTDLHAFMRTYCVAQLHGGMTVALNKYWVYPPFAPQENATSCEICNHQGQVELYNAVEGRFCMPKGKGLEKEVQKYKVPELYFVTRLVETWKPRIDEYNKKALEKYEIDRIPGVLFSSELLKLLECK